MIQNGINTRVGPICRTVEDTARVLDAYAGYDAKDELTVFSIGRKPKQPYHHFATEKRLNGMRIGVVRELMSQPDLKDASRQTNELIDKALGELQKLGAEIVDPGENGSLLGECVRKYAPRLGNKLFAQKFPDAFPAKDGKPEQPGEGGPPL